MTIPLPATLDLAKCMWHCALIRTRFAKNASPRVGTRHAMGVRYSHKGQDEVARCSREIILAGGAVNSPQLLIREGNYLVIAKVHVFTSGGVIGYTPVNCVLSGGGEDILVDQPGTVPPPALRVDDPRGNGARSARASRD